MNRHKILLVEDEGLIRLLLSEVMADNGFEVVEVATGEEAMAWLGGGESFDLLLTDIQLPGSMDGLDIARAVRARNASLPIIFTTGQPDRMGAWRAGRTICSFPNPIARPISVRRRACC
jgi:CheY-like chemotaxis protein